MTNITCPACGKQYGFNSQMAGRQVRCQSCGHAFLVQTPAGSEGLEIIDGPVAASGRFGGKRSDAIDYEIFGTEMQFAEITLDPGEMVIAEAGSMMYMTSGIKMDTVLGDPSQENQG